MSPRSGDRRLHTAFECILADPLQLRNRRPIDVEPDPAAKVYFFNASGLLLRFWHFERWADLTDDVRCWGQPC